MKTKNNPAKIKKNKEIADYWKRTEQELEKLYGDKPSRYSLGIKVGRIRQFHRDKAAHEKQMRAIRAIIEVQKDYYEPIVYKPIVYKPRIPTEKEISELNTIIGSWIKRIRKIKELEQKEVQKDA